MKYYIEDKSQPKGFQEVTEAEYNAIFGDTTIRPYAQAVYRGDIALDDVPYEHKEAVSTVVSNKVSRWGLYYEAVDIEGAPFTYEETETPIESERNIATEESANEN